MAYLSRFDAIRVFLKSFLAINGLEVFDHLKARGKSRAVLGESHARKGGVLFGGVQMEPVVTLVPGRADAVAPLQHEKRDASSPETGARRQPSRAAADDHRIGLFDGCVQAGDWVGHGGQHASKAYGAASISDP